MQKICADDGGALVGAHATQWARDATNIDAVTARLSAATGLTLEVLTPEQEGIYGYAAATRNAPGRIALDPGSNSFQIAFWPKGTAAPRTISVPFGYVRAAAQFYAADADTGYEISRREHARELGATIRAALAALAPPADLAELRRAVSAGALERRLFVAGQDGSLHLAMRGRLREAPGRWIAAKPAYDARVGTTRPIATRRYGEITTVLTRAEVRRWFRRIVGTADYVALRSDPARSLYGEKALANAVLMDVLMSELGLDAAVIVPQEMPAGFILAKVSAEEQLRAASAVGSRKSAGSSPTRSR
jgi:hypothetical protein